MARTYIERIIREKKLAQVDAKTPTTVVVTQSDIVKAKSRNSKCCAFALAGKRKPGVVDAYFFLTTAYFEYKDQMVRYKLPPSVQKEIISFDRAKIVSPGSYQLTPPAPSIAPAATKKKRAAVKRKAKQVERVRVWTKPVKQADLQQKIAKIAASEPAPALDTPEGRLFDKFLTVKEANLGAAKPRAKAHKTAYVRSMQEPLW